MKNKLIGILILFFGAIIIAGVLYFLFAEKFGFPSINSFFETEKIAIETKNEQTPKKEEKPLQTEEVTKINVTDPVTEKNNFKPVKRTEKVFDKDDLLRLAASFSERFGSYSNQSNFSNIIDLKLFMSKKMKQWADSYVLSQRQKSTVNEIYYGITTKAVSRELIDFDDDVGHAEVVVGARRREATSSSNNTSKVFAQTIILKFIKENNAWKVDSAHWQD